MDFLNICYWCSAHWLYGKSCPLGWPCFRIVFSLFVFLAISLFWGFVFDWLQFMFIAFVLHCILSICDFFISHFGFESRICLLIAAVPVHCFLITFINTNYRN